MRRKMITTIALVWLVIMLIILVVYLFVDYKYKNKNGNTTTTSTTTTTTQTTTLVIGDILDIKDIKSFISYTNKSDNKNEISIKNSNFKKTVIPSDIDNYCGKQYSYDSNTFDVNCVAETKFVRLTLNNKLSFNVNLSEETTTETSIYENDKYYIIYEAAPNNRVGTIDVYTFAGKHLFADLIINHNGLKDKETAIPFIQDNRLYYVTSQFDESEGFFCAIEYVDFNDDAKTNSFGRYDCNPE